MYNPFLGFRLSGVFYDPIHMLSWNGAIRTKVEFLIWRIASLTPLNATETAIAVYGLLMVIGMVDDVWDKLAGDDAFGVLLKFLPHPPPSPLKALTEEEAYPLFWRRVWKVWEQATTALFD
jgi:hypothetical protein